MTGDATERFPTCALTAHELGAAFRAGELSPVEAAEDVLGAIEAVDPELNAFCLLAPDVTRSMARRAEQRHSAGTPLGPLDGVPASIKDVFLTTGFPTFRGSLLLAEAEGADDPARYTEDGPATAATVEAGCVIVGKVTSPEFAWKGVTDSPLTGITRNPYDPELTPGGSSGGSSAAVAAGLGPLSVGTDAGGSVRIPASFTGTVALKPTYGVIPMFPNSPFGTLAHAGPMTRTVVDNALYMDALIRPDPRDWSAVPPAATSPQPGGYEAAAVAGASGDRPLAGVRVAYSSDMGFGHNDADVEREVARSVRVMAELGAEVEEVDLDMRDPIEAFHVLWFSGLAAVLAPHGEGAIERVDPWIREALERHHGFTAQDYLDAVAVRMALGSRMGVFHQTYDVLVTPTMPIPAFAAGTDVPPGWPSRDWATWTPYTYPFNMTQQPALSVPCGVTDSGLPVGVQVVGARFDDRRVVRVGAALEAALADPVPRPRIHACAPGSSGAAVSGG